MDLILALPRSGESLARASAVGLAEPRCRPRAELALREMGRPSLLVALDYLDLLAEVKPEKLERAAVRWHGRLEVEAAAMTLAESQLALAALASLCAGEREAVNF